MKTAFTLITFALALLAQAQTAEVAPKSPETAGEKAPAQQNGAADQNKTDAPDKKSTPGDGARSFIYKTAGKVELKLFAYTPNGHQAEAKAPAIVFFHGGGFQGGSEKAFDPQATYLAERGMVAICVRYRLISQKGVEVSDCVEDAISAMRWVRANAANLGVDPDRIAASGGSAGGYLSAATLLTDHINAKTDPAGVSAKPNALVLFNPGFGNREGDGTDPRNSDGKGNLVNQVKPGAPPTIIFHGKDDVTVPFATVEAFTEVMIKAGNRCELIGYEGEGHSFFHKGKGYKSTLAETDKFLTGLGWLAKKAAKP